MTEHPETLRIAPGDRRADSRALDSDSRISLPAPGWKLPNPYDGSYRVIMASIAIAILVGSYFIIGGALRIARAWLSAQPSYQLPFEEIQITPLPEWFVGGNQAFLKRVKELAGISRPLSVLDLEAEQVKAMFVQSPWVEDVIRVSRPPQGLRVDLRYREPVAWVQLAGKKPEKVYLIDDSAMILPSTDVDRDRLKQCCLLLVIGGAGLTDPAESDPGKVWEPRPAIADITSEGNGRIKPAARLAGFLVEKMRSLGANRSPALEFRMIDPMDHRGFFLFSGVTNDPTRPSHCFLWGNEAPGEETSGNLTAEEKWAILRDWSVHQSQQILPPGDYWRFSKEGLLHVPTVPTSNQRSSRNPNR